MSNIAIVLAAGSGSRMKSDIPKQFIEVCGKPLLCYSLDAFSQSEYVDEIVIVTGEDDMDYVSDEIVVRFGYEKVKRIVAGGSERYISVANAIKVIDEDEEESSIIYIHDGARPLVSVSVIKDAYENAKSYGASVAAVAAKDTIRRVDKDRVSKETLNRNELMLMQTPQAFKGKIVSDAYGKLMKDLNAGKELGVITDDAQVVFMYENVRAKMSMGDYRNIKVTTPEDLVIAEAFLLIKEQ